MVDHTLAKYTVIQPKMPTTAANLMVCDKWKWKRYHEGEYEQPLSYPDQQLNYFTILRPSTSAIFAQMPLFVTYAASAGQRVCRVHTSTPLSCSAAGSYGREGTGLFSARRTCPLHTSYRCANWKPERGVADCHETMRSSATNGAQFFLWQCKTIRKPVYLQTI